MIKLLSFHMILLGNFNKLLKCWVITVIVEFSWAVEIVKFFLTYLDFLTHIIKFINIISLMI
jgi:hypothetical protein